MRSQKINIIDTGKHLPRAGMSDWFELQGNRKQFVQKPILNQSRKNGTVLYGRFAVNKIIGKGLQRDTYDFDVYSNRPLKHALEIEQSIDRGTNSNLAYVEKTHYEEGGRKHPLVRIKIRPHETTEADFNKMPKGLKFVKIKGVKYEHIDKAEMKYSGMIKRGERGHSPFLDKNDIRMFNLIRSRRML